MVELGGTWVLLAGIRDGAYLNGYHALRLQDLVRVEAHATFVPLLQRRQSWPPAAPISCPDLSETRSIITARVSLTGVVSDYREATRPGTLLIGAPVEWVKKSVWLLPITPEGRWEQFMDKIRLKDITQIGFGDDYERAVLELARPLPSRSARHGQPASSDTPRARLGHWRRRIKCAHEVLLPAVDPLPRYGPGPDLADRRRDADHGRGHRHGAGP